MEPRQPGNKNLPDFDKLNDRIIRDANQGPMLYIQTNLDKDNVKDDNPYIAENKQVDGELKEFFDEP
ncbi:hypothetical protein [Peribacillus sp. SCS-155]|uniref:hypothetical protein n=1 Tax=Peribacillus sedimenti TaxID=3115297 RepID=UPI0039059164